MNKEELLTAIEQYRNSNLDRAILLDGAWGSGKTYFVQNFLENKPKHIYLSVFGFKNISEMDKAILAGAPKDIFDNGKRSTKARTRQIMLKIPDFVKDILKQLSIEGIKLPDSLLNETTIINASSAAFKDCLIIIDDVERSTIPLSESLGKISIYTEQNGFKVLLVANTKEIPDDEAALFKKYLDKIIREKLSFQQDYRSILLDLIEKAVDKDTKKIFKDNLQAMLNFIDTFDLSNIRQIRSGIEKANETIKILQSNSLYKKEKEYKDLITDIIHFSLYNESGLNNYKIEQYQDIQFIRLETRFDGPCDIRYFDFIATYGVLEIRTHQKYILNSLEKHLETLIDSRQIQDDPVMSLYNNSYRIEDDEIITLEQTIIDKLKSNKYTYKFYPRILLVLIRCKNIMQDSSFLNTARSYIFSHLENIDDRNYDFIDLATFTFYGPKEMNEYKNEMNKLRNAIRNLKEEKAFLSINKAIKEKDWSERLKSTVFENEEEIISKKQFFSILDTSTIITKLKSEDTKTIDFCNVRDAITGIYHRLKDQPDLFYDSDYNALLNFHDEFTKIQPKTHTSKQVFEYIKKDLESYIESFNMIRGIK